MIACIVLGLLFVVGLVLLLVGLINRKKPKYEGKKSPVVCISIGSVLLLIPVVTVVVLIGNAVYSEIIEKNIRYDNVADKWRHQDVYDHQAVDEAIDALLSSADKGDSEAFADVFTPNLQKDIRFDNELDAFFKNYPVGLSQCELDGGLTSSNSSFVNDESVENASAYFTCVLDGEWYFITMKLCYDNTASPDDVGITFFCIENLEANAVGREYSDNEHIICELVDEKFVSARLICGKGFCFTDYPEREISEEMMRSCLESCDSISEISQLIGEPNVTKKYDGSAGCDYYYELTPENGEPRYAHISTSRNGDLLYAYVCSDTDSLDRELY